VACKAQHKASMCILLPLIVFSFFSSLYAVMYCAPSCITGKDTTSLRRFLFSFFHGLPKRSKCISFSGFFFVFAVFSLVDIHSKKALFHDGVADVHFVVRGTAG
jgi:hypothetical protein